ncbi:Stf0 family sulfotransferase [Bradyrhizobium sp. Tv2a-2]|uniref:Stf0 family sulfotransferase n=1 Tax=Bradyrhizobium sp. Tv2a-2 TaxID=113395 RepID=UPI0004642857|nr:Stf0 family sulfotransferase [Bradyrhizobium sp. Tv2a-2]
MRIPKEVYDLKNVHIEQLRPYLIPSKKRLRPRRCKKIIFLCFTNRSGSNFLAELLGSTKQVNIAGEFLNFDTALTHIRKGDLSSFYDYFVGLADTLSVNGNFACKIAITQIALIQQAGLLDDLMPNSRFVVSERADLLGQAISLEIASRTGQWTSYMQPTGAVAEADFNHNRLEMIIRNLAREQELFRLFFAINGLDHFPVGYEQLTSHTETVMRMLCEWLEMQAPPDCFERTSTQRQSDSVNNAWRSRFLGVSAQL